MNYIHTKTNEYPVFEQHIINRNKGFDDYAVVYNSDVPLYDKWTQMCVEGMPVDVDGTYFRTYSVVDMTESQIEAYLKKNTPSVITPRQLRLQLLTLGLLDEVEALCSADKAMSIWFEYSLDFQRNHEMLQAMATQLGLTDADMDNFFIAASKL